jgi:pSer/pThr/pTyr-binding forkhead associated (FHA) protein
LDASEITIGSDPTQAVIAMDDNSLSSLHARLYRTENGSFSIQDEGSQSGTWVNYEQVSPEGTNLQHGDIIHLGRVGLCITYSDANRIPKLKILHLET